MIDVTVLICTRNRVRALAAALASLTRAAMRADGVSIEAIVVDNGSTDETPALLDRWAAGQRFPVRAIREDVAGLARARNAGLAHRGGAIVAMTDDDCVLHRDYLIAIVNAFAATPGPAVIGGRILLGDPADLRVTVKLEDHAMVANPRAFPGGFVMGANLAFNADALGRIGGFDERFGAGAPFVAAEDTDFLLRATKLGIPVLYDPYIVVDHHHGRREVEDETRLLAGYSFGDGALYAKHLLRDRRIAGFVLSDLWALTQDFIRPATSHAGIPRFQGFRLFHKIRGMLAYGRWRWRSRVGALSTKN